MMLAVYGLLIMNGILIFSNSLQISKLEKEIEYLKNKTE